MISMTSIGQTSPNSCFKYRGVSYDDVYSYIFSLMLLPDAFRITSNVVRRAPITSKSAITSIHRANMSSGAGDLNIENTNIKTAPGVTLDEKQKTYVGCVLDVTLPSPYPFSSFSTSSPQILFPPSN